MTAQSASDAPSPVRDTTSVSTGGLGSWHTDAGNVPIRPTMKPVNIMVGGAGALAVTNFSHAYARGWTGLGSLVTIADTGVDAAHPDLAPGGACPDYTGTGMPIRMGTERMSPALSPHGAMVSVHGGAFDAQLAVAKVATGWSYDFGLARAAPGGVTSGRWR